MNISIYTWFYFHSFWNSFQCSLNNYKLKLIIINSYEHFKPIELNPQLNPENSFRTHCHSKSSVS